MINIEQESFMQRLSFLKLSLKTTYNKIEKDLGYPRNALQNYRHGKIPSGKRLVELANYFGVTPEYLLGINNFSNAPTVKENFEYLSEAQKKEMYLLCQEWFIKNL
ncbi:MAG: helix-turn-helix domain-containing protein [Lactococcus cremoris]